MGWRSDLGLQPAPDSAIGLTLGEQANHDRLSRINAPRYQAVTGFFSRNYVATYNPFERRFAQFLDQAADVLRFASLGTTEQGESGTQFRVDYLKPSGAIGFYHPDWAVVQATPKGEVNWIIETKGRVWEGTEAKDAAISEWCQHISQQTGGQWWFARVNQVGFEAQTPVRLSEMVKGEARPAGGQARYSSGSGSPVAGDLAGSQTRVTPKGEH